MKLELYHGSNNEIKKFDYKYVGKGNDQEGVGFYLTNSKDDAKRYGKYVYEVEVYYRKLVPTSGRKNLSDLRYLIVNAPESEETVLNWDENPKVGYQKATQAIAQFTKNPHDMFMQVWYDFYRYSPKEYLKNMVKLGYDGVLINKGMGLKHFIAFDPDKLKLH